MLVGAAFVGFLAARLVWVSLRPTLASPSLIRSNYRGRTVVTGAGIVLPLAALIVEGGRAAASALGVGREIGIGGARLVVLLGALGFGLVGLIDDLLGADERRGFRGHAGVLARGRMTTGGVKLVGGIAVALVVVSPAAGRSGGRLVADGALVALSANLGNLVDKRPGRLIKASTVLFVVLALAASTTHALVGVAVLVGASLGLFRDDLHEHLMLGDVGANVLGAALGLGVVLGCGPTTRVVVLVVVALLNVASEVVSFSDVIDGIGLLRAADRAGRLP